MNYIDLHCDTALRLLDEGGELYRNNYSIDIEKLKKGNALAQFFAMFVELNLVENPFEQYLKLINNFKKELDKNKDSIALVGSLKELEEENSKGRIGAFLSIEEGEVLMGDASNV
ncbi:MAG: membrane dipeptidase, partial [Clostridium sp.]